jgi:hypothetical protein
MNIHKKEWEIFLFLFALVLCLSSCFVGFKNEKYNLREGTFSYKDEEYKLTEGLYIEELKMSFSIISEDEYSKSTPNNCVRDRKNKTPFSIGFYIKFKNTEINSYSIEVKDKIGDQVDRFYINIYVDNEFVKDDIIKAVFELRNWNNEDDTFEEIEFEFKSFERNMDLELNKTIMTLYYEGED